MTSIQKSFLSTKPAGAVKKSRRSSCPDKCNWVIEVTTLELDTVTAEVFHKTEAEANNIAQDIADAMFDASYINIYEII